jgi:MFS family permease
VLALAMAAITLGVSDTAGLPAQLGRNLRFACIGNALGAAVMGAVGSVVAPEAAIWLAALLCLPALGVLRKLGRGMPHAVRRSAGDDDGPAALRPGQGIWPLLARREVLAVAAFAVLFHAANGSLLLLAAGGLVATAGDQAQLVVAACIVAPQLTMALLSGGFAVATARWGRRPVLALALAALPLRAALLAFVHDPVLVIPVQMLEGVSGTAFALLVPLTAAEIARERGGYTLVTGLVGLASGLGAGLSTVVGGSLAAAFGLPVAFLALAMGGLGAGLLYWLTAPADSADAPADPVAGPAPAPVVPWRRPVRVIPAATVPGLRESVPAAQGALVLAGAAGRRPLSAA